MHRAPSPTSFPELEARAAALIGLSLGHLAADLGAEVPTELRRAKGWIGQLVEAALGAEAGSKPTPDFEALGVELKTIPVDEHGRPHESTFVCTAPIEGAFDASWEESRVRRKLARVLWVPVRGRRGEDLATRVIGRPRLWVPDSEEDAALARDWRELSELIVGGELHRIHGRLGRVLQLRPKGANAGDFAWMMDEEGEWVRAVPYGFYLRAGFTRQVLLGAGAGSRAP